VTAEAQPLVSVVVPVWNVAHLLPPVSAVVTVSRDGEESRP
jgi:hypothetical protein